ncbi:efflux RND transporter periplasmic adaptor subunit [Magnetofaba australis]|nr:efflux RND transporter periplasmic adaptor subunit [Magnetofaba australis]
MALASRAEAVDAARAALEAPLGASAALRCLSTPARDVTLTMPVTGQIQELAVMEGDRVKPGDLLLRVDDRLADIEYKRRKMIANDASELKAAKARLRSVSQRLKAAMELLQSTHSISQDEVDELALERVLANSDVTRLLHEQSVQAIEARRAKLEKESHRLTAPFDGTVVEILTEQGATIHADQPLIRLVDTRTGVLECSLESDGDADLKVGGRMTIGFPAHNPTTMRHGVVSFVSPLQDSASHLRKIKIRFDNADGAVLLGMAGIILANVQSPAEEARVGARSEASPREKPARVVQQ